MSAAAGRQLTGVITTPQQHWHVLFEGQRKAVVLWKRGRKEAEGREWHVLEPGQEITKIAGCEGDADIYVSPNEFHGWRKSKLLAALNALWVDIDLRDTDTTPTEAAETALSKLRAAGLPEPNLIVYTGRGCHLYYLIKRTLPKALPRWQAAQRALVQLLSGDPNASDCTRVLRLVGSRNPKAPQESQTVTGHVLRSERYDFDWLLDQIMIPRSELRDIRAERAARAAARQAKAGADGAPRNVGTIYKVWYDRYVDIHKIVHANWGETVPEGFRDLIIFHAAVCLSWFTHGYSLPAEVEKLTRRIAPSLTDTEVKSITSTVLQRAKDFEEGGKGNYRGLSVDPRYRYKSQTLYEIFAHLIEPHEGLLDQLKSIIPTSERLKRRAQRDAKRDRVAEGRYQVARSVLQARQQGIGQQINALKLAGKSWPEIGQELGLTADAARMRHTRWQAGAPCSLPSTQDALEQVPDALQRRLAAHVQAGLTIRRIAEIEGLSKSTVGRRLKALSQLEQNPPSCMVAGATDFGGLSSNVFFENDRPIEGGLGGEASPVDNSHPQGAVAVVKPSRNTKPKISADPPRKRRSKRTRGMSLANSVDERVIVGLRRLSFEETVARAGWVAKEDHSYQPRESAAQAGTRRYHLSTSESATVHELLVTWPLWYDVREKKGGRGSISFVMYFGSMPFPDACSALDSTS